MTKYRYTLLKDPLWMNAKYLSLPKKVFVESEFCLLFQQLDHLFSIKVVVYKNLKKTCCGALVVSCPDFQNFGNVKDTISDSEFTVQRG